MRKWTGAMMLTAILGMAPAAEALELRAGVVRQDFESLWAAGTEFERDWAINAELAFDPLLSVLGGEVGPFIGGTLAPGGEVDKVYAGLGLTFSANFLFLRVGLGGAYHNGDTDDPDRTMDRRQFGSRLLFHIPAEVGVWVTDFVSASLYFDHVSNGGADRPNPGMDTLGIRLGVRF